MVETLHHVDTSEATLTTCKLETTGLTVSTGWRFINCSECLKFKPMEWMSQNDPQAWTDDE